MKQSISLMRLIEHSKGNKQELNLLYNLVKKHTFFKGERKKLYSLIVKYKSIKK